MQIFAYFLLFVYKAHMDDELLTPQEVADRLKVKVGTLALWRQQAKPDALPWVKINGSVRYRRSDLETWINERTLGGALPV